MRSNETQTIQHDFNNLISQQQDVFSPFNQNLIDSKTQFYQCQQISTTGNHFVIQAGSNIFYHQVESQNQKHNTNSDFTQQQKIYKQPQSSQNLATLMLQLQSSNDSDQQFINIQDKFTDFQSDKFDSMQSFLGDASLFDKSNQNMAAHPIKNDSTFKDIQLEPLRIQSDIINKKYEDSNLLNSLKFQKANTNLFNQKGQSPNSHCQYFESIHEQVFDQIFQQSEAKQNSFGIAKMNENIQQIQINKSSLHIKQDNVQSHSIKSHQTNNLSNLQTSISLEQVNQLKRDHIKLQSSTSIFSNQESIEDPTSTAQNYYNDNQSLGDFQDNNNLACVASKILRRFDNNCNYDNITKTEMLESKQGVNYNPQNYRSHNNSISAKQKSKCRKRPFMKRQQKTDDNLQILFHEFQSNPFWNKEQMQRLASITGLSFSQVYKWNWDQRRFVEKLYVKEIFNNKLQADQLFNAGQKKIEKQNQNIELFKAVKSESNQVQQFQ